MRIPVPRFGEKGWSRWGRPATSLVEFALVVPVFFLVIFGILEYARLLFAIQLVNNAAREGARYAVVNTTTATTAEVQTYVDGFMANQGTKLFTGYTATGSITVYKADPSTGQNLGASWQNASWGDAVGVTITGTYQPMLPGLTQLASSMTLTGTCVMTTEAN
jgi:Flp pilus assembly protein TadG